MFDFRRLGTAAMFLILLAAGPARAAPEVGWWWNPNESGRGFFVESQNGIIYLAGYFYEPDGRATWLVAGGPNADPYNYQGRLLAYSNGQTLVGGYKPPSPPTDAGPVSISFSDDSHGTIVWPGGTIPIVRQVFGSGEAAFETHNGWWWNDAESGRGYSVERQGDKLFVVGFMYDGAGKPVWYYSAGSMATATHYAGPWLQFAGGQTLLGPYQPPAAPVIVGQLSLDFTAANRATVKIQEGPAVAGDTDQKNLKGNSIIFEVAPQFTPKQIPIPEVFKGDFIYNWEFVVTKNGGTSRTTAKWTVNEVELQLNADGLATIPVVTNQPNGPWLRFGQVSGKVVLEVDQESNAPGVRCITPKQRIKFDLEQQAVKLHMNHYGQYYGSIEQLNVPIDLSVTCTASNGISVTTPFKGNFSLNIDLGTGAVVKGSVPGSTIVSGVQPNVSVPYNNGQVDGKLDTSAVWGFSATK